MSLCKDCCESLPLTAKQGATFTKTIAYQDEYGNPIDLTDYTARMEVKESYTNTATQIVDLTLGDGIEIDELAGLIYVTITADETSALEAPWTGVYDLIIQHDDLVQRILQGTFYVSPRVTEDV